MKMRISFLKVVPFVLLLAMLGQACGGRSVPEPEPPEPVASEPEPPAEPIDSDLPYVERREEVLDAVRITQSFIGETNGARYSVPARDWLGDEDVSTLAFRSSNIRAATVDEEGAVAFADEGRFFIQVTIPAEDGEPVKRRIHHFENVLDDGQPAMNRVRYEPDPLNISEHVLVVYNANSPESEELKDYYIQERPGFGEANVLGLECPTGEIVSVEEYTGRIETPVVEWLTGSGKHIRYIVLMMDIPTRVHAPTLPGSSVSFRLSRAFVEHGLREGRVYFDQPYSHLHTPTHIGTPFSLGQFQGMTALVTHLNMGSLEACKAYVDKIKTFPETNGILHPETDSYASNYYMEDHDARSRLPPNWFGFRYVERMEERFERFDEMNIIYRPKGSEFITSGSNVAFFGTLGVWGRRGADYAIDGSVEWGENADWWLMMSVESYNGQSEPARRQGAEEHVFYSPMNQGNFVDWFSPGAFGGTDYSRTPVGAVSHVEEPRLAGVNNWGYLAMWHDGFTFAEAAWLSRHTGFFMALGDPLVARIPPESKP